jgi:uncharacterized protein (TIGR02145 family)
METKLNSKGKRFFAPAIAAGLALAMAFTLSACGGDGGGGGGDDAPSSSSSGNGSLSSSSSSGGSLSSSSGSSSSGASSSSSNGDTPSSSSQPPPKCDEYNHDEKFCDERNGKLYKYVEINGQTWMAENLNFNADGSKCGSTLSGSGTLSDADAVACDKYGRLYDWATAMGLEASCNSSACNSQIQPKHQGVCPSGWHIPSDEDWDKLMRYADGTSGTNSPYDSPTAGRYLKAASDWNDCGSSGSGSSYLCEDTHGFSALPGGSGSSGGIFNDAGDDGVWWSASEYGGSSAYGRFMVYDDVYAYWGNDGKSYLYSVRCLRD